MVKNIACIPLLMCSASLGMQPPHAKLVCKQLENRQQLPSIRQQLGGFFQEGSASQVTRETASSQSREHAELILDEKLTFICAPTTSKQKAVELFGELVRKNGATEKIIKDLYAYTAIADVRRSTEILFEALQKERQLMTLKTTLPHVFPGTSHYASMRGMEWVAHMIATDYPQALGKKNHTTDKNSQEKLTTAQTPDSNGVHHAGKCTPSNRRQRLKRCPIPSKKSAFHPYLELTDDFKIICSPTIPKENATRSLLSILQGADLIEAIRNLYASTTPDNALWSTSLLIECARRKKSMDTLNAAIAHIFPEARDAIGCGPRLAQKLVSAYPDAFKKKVGHGV